MQLRAVITGIGLATAVGNGVRDYWNALIEGRSGIDFITLFDTSECAVRIGGEVKGLDLKRYVPPQRSRKMPRAAKLAVASARMALEDTGIEMSEDNSHELDLFLGVACPDLSTYARVVGRRLRRGYKSVDPNAVAVVVTAAPAGCVSIELGISGETMTFSTGCSSGTNAIGHALRRIRSGAGKVILAGGADCGIQADMLASYSNAGALSTRKGDPRAACRPFEANRDGHVMSEAAGILVVEEYEHAKARGARVYAELAGYGTSSDAHSMSRVNPDVRHSARSLGNALSDARLCPERIDYYCAHGSAARATDARETRMLKTALGEHAYRTPVSSVKSMTGHPFGASGALQTAACALAVHDKVIPPTINYDEPDPECDLDYVPNEAREDRIDAALTYALGVGGNNAALALVAC
ncbi:MAG: beta-ketoacyl-[acyl-carrier-protein] synthase family protein [Planctomycetota bacterium]|jgi:3-oxoacyl-[acyl-carrier-protein] synthase II